MDPLSITASGIAVVTVCVQVASVLRTIVETYKNCPEELSALLSRAEGLSIQLRRLEAVKISLSHDQLVYLSQICDETKCRSTVHELNSLVWKIQRIPDAGPGGGALGDNGYEKLSSEEPPSGKENSSKKSALSAMKWYLNKENAAKLVQRLKDHQQDIFMAVTTITMEASLDTHANTKAILRNSAHSLTKLLKLTSMAADAKVKESMNTFLHSTDPVPAFAVAVGPPQPPPQYTANKPMLQNLSPTKKSPNRLALQNLKHLRREFQSWMGGRRAYDTKAQYYDDRKELSSSAYSGMWDILVTRIYSAGVTWEQDWINCIRVGEGSSPSGYAPLHQAAWYGISVAQTQRLIDLGAWRTLRTLREGECTPLEIAKRMRSTHLYEILAPVIRHPVPMRVQLTLETALHELIERESSEEDMACLRQTMTRYPEISVLTEMEVPLLWFPIREDIKRSRGFMIRLDGRDLVVKSPNAKQFRITSEGEVRAIEEAVIFSDEA